MRKNANNFGFNLYYGQYEEQEEQEEQEHFFFFFFFFFLTKHNNNKKNKNLLWVSGGGHPNRERSYKNPRRMGPKMRIYYFEHSCGGWVGIVCLFSAIWLCKN